MAQSGIKPEDQIRKTISLKRKRPASEDEDAENIMPPTKQWMSMYAPSCQESEGTLPLDSSSPLESTSDEDASSLAHEYDEAAATDTVYSDDNLFSPQYNVLSPLENVLRNESTSHLKRKHSKSSTAVIARKRKCPFPSLSWADHCDVWQKMCERDASVAASCSDQLFRGHPGLQLRMRAILLDWLNEVCEVYKMYRETFHLTVNYIDRYLSSTENVYKGRLQLIGITCLFIAAKVEEVYPPKIGEFAYVTDGACTAEEILAEEIVILSELNWRTTPTTINGWLNAYMQLYAIHEAKRQPAVAGTDELRQYTFIFPQYSSLEYVVCGQLVDLAVLHVGVNAFSYSLLAAAAIAHIFDRAVAMRVSSYTWEELSPCYRWLSPFAEVLADDAGTGAGCEAPALRMLPDCGADFVASGGGLARICPDINLDQSHRIQVHNICLDLFDKAQESMAASKKTSIESTPTTSNAIESVPRGALVTPPRSGQKQEELPATTPTQPLSLTQP